jgi:hypothetical protein
MTDRLIRGAFPLRRFDRPRVALASFILGKRLYQQIAVYLFDQGVASVPRRIEVRGRR